MCGLDDLGHWFHRAGEAGGWLTAAGGTAMAIWGAITPEVVNQWYPVVFGVLAAGLGLGSAAYIRFVKVRCAGSTIRAIYEDNLAAKRAGRPLPHPEFWIEPKKK